MAEKYGEVPKLFTKEWWEYFWDYYKWHTIAILSILLIAGVTIYHQVTQPKYEFNVSYSADLSISDESELALEKKMSEFVTDSDGDGMDGVDIRQLTFIEGTQEPQVEYTMITKLQLEMTDENTIIYIFDDNKAKYLVESESMEGAFLEADEWLASEVEEEKLYIHDGKAYAVKLNGSKILEDCGIAYDNLYIALRNHNEDIDDEMKEKIADAKEIANAIIE